VNAMTSAKSLDEAVASFSVFEEAK